MNEDFHEKFKFPLAFRAVRIKRGLRYYDIAQALGIGSAQVSDICVGRQKPPKEFVQKLYACQLITACDATKLSVAASGDQMTEEYNPPATLTDITPEEYRCTGGTCPAIYRTPDGKLVIIGKRYIDSTIKDRIGIDEAAIKVPADMLKRALSNERSTQAHPSDCECAECWQAME